MHYDISFLDTPTLPRCRRISKFINDHFSYKWKFLHKLLYSTDFFLSIDGHCEVNPFEKKSESQWESPVYGQTMVQKSLELL
jgi:hypothetical protein